MVMQKVSPATTDERKRGQSSPDCAHHFLIEPPNGHASRGVCKLCGVVREFLNFLPYDEVDLIKARQGGEHTARKRAVGSHLSPYVAAAELYRTLGYGRWT